MKKEKTEMNTEKVPVTVPRGAGDLFVSVNDKSYILPEGKTSCVPKYIAEEVLRAENAKDLFAADAAKRQEQSRL